MSGIRRGLLWRLPALAVGAVACVGMLAALGPVTPARADGGGSLPPAAARAVREARTRKDPARLAAAAKAARPVGKPVVPAAARSAEPDGLVASAVWGTSPWEYRVENGQRVLTLHAGTIDNTYSPGEWASEHPVADMLPDKGSGLSVIRIDPGVAAAYGEHLFAGLPSLLRIEGGGNLDVSKATWTYQMFKDDVALQSVDVGDWDMSNVTNTASMFKNCRSLRSLDVGNWNVSNVSQTGWGGEEREQRGDGQYNESAPEHETQGMFENDSMLTFLDVGRWDVGSLTNASGMFRGDTSLEFLDVGGWNTYRLKYAAHMFEDDAMLDNLFINDWDPYSIEGMAYMFRACGSLKSIAFSHKVNYQTTFDSMVYMFADDPSLVSVDMDHDQFDSLEYFGHMFANDPALLSVDLSDTWWQINYRMDYMFAGDRSLTDVNFRGVKTGLRDGVYPPDRMEHMFDGASSLSYLDLSPFSPKPFEGNPLYQYVRSEGMFAGATALRTLVLPYTACLWMANSGLPDVPAAGSRVPGSSQVVASSRWVALNGSAKGSMYTSQQLMDMGPRSETTVYQWDVRDA